ncbi:uncharacterized protein [Dendrobates tinctorius]|uniref:uncharacterized protein n=1 Tax=Dendrobates tinctorius TaxID=92724 RepID=UPI003CC95889
MDVRRVVVVLFTIFFYCAEARPTEPPEAVSQRPWTGTIPRLNLEISDDNNIMRRYVLPIGLMITVASFVGTLIFCFLYGIRRCRGKQKEADLTEVVVLKPDEKVPTSDKDSGNTTRSDHSITIISDNTDNEPSNTEESPDKQESMPMCKIPGCFLEEIVSPSSIYVTKFQENKEELANRLYRLYNETIFRNQLPEEMEIVWVEMPPPVAGITYTLRRRRQRCCRIELSDNVVTSVERLRSTLAHEMCHAACWLIDEERVNHGPLWQAYAKDVTSIHAELPEVEKNNYYRS